MSIPGSQILVIGAGMVGVCCAIYLQRQGYKVTLVDRNEPGLGASYGNLGIIGLASCPPLALPGIVGQVPGMLLDRHAPLKLRLGDLVETAPWLLRTLANSRRQRVERIARDRQSLLDMVHPSLDPIVADAGSTSLLRDTGLLYTCESEQAFKASAYAFDLRRRCGVDFELLDGHESRQLEPALSRTVYCSWYVQSLFHVRDPHALVKSLAALFVREGGTILQTEVKELRRRVDDNVAVTAGSGAEELVADQVVVAAGAWSRQLLATMGIHVPLVAERGYHVVYEDATAGPRIPMLSVDRKIAVTPMRAGIRVGGLSEFAHVDSTPDANLTSVATAQAEALLPRLRADRRSTWSGPRPSFPDSKPAIGIAPGLRNLWYAFGHDHLGLTLGAVTGRLLSELISGQTPCVDPRPFSPRRFSD